MRYTVVLLAASALAQTGPAASPAKPRPPRVPRPGVPAVQKPMANVKPEAVFPIEGVPDWSVITPTAVWISNKPKNTVHKLDIKSNKVETAVTVGEKPCSGLAYGFGAIWVPNCGDQTLSKVDEKTAKVVATIPVGPAHTEGGLACSKDSVWMATGEKGTTVVRIDPDEHKVVAEVVVPEGTYTVAFGEDAIWATSTTKSVVSRIDPETNLVTDTIEVGPNPRFLTVGEGFVWTLNQKDGTVSKIDPKLKKTVATIEVGVPGGGGDISAGGGSVWVTSFEVPISRIDPETNKVTHQFAGPGGDAIRFGHNSVWLSNLREQNIWRIEPWRIGGKHPD
jgi:streptogramin lyase